MSAEHGSPLPPAANASNASEALAPGASPASALQVIRDLVHVIDALASDAVFLLGPQGRVQTWSHCAEIVFGYRAEEIVGQPLSTLFREELREDRSAPGRPDGPLEAAQRDGRSEARGHGVRRGGERFAARAAVLPLFGLGDRLRGFGVVIAESTADRPERPNQSRETRPTATSPRAPTEAAYPPSAGDRTRHLAPVEDTLRRATAVLSESLDEGSLLADVARTLVPAFADACAIHVATDNGVERAALVGSPSIAASDIEELERRWPVRLDDERGPGRVLRTGQAELEPNLGALAAAPEGGTPEMAGPWGLRSGLAVPIRVRGATLGVLSLVRAAPGAPFEREGVMFAEELGRRIAIAMESSRTHREARDAVRVREEFLSVAGHELKTPLTALLLQLQSIHAALATGTAAENLARWGERAGKAVGQARRLDRLVNELLDVSRISGGRLVLEREDVELGPLVGEVAERHATELARSGSTVQIDEAGDTRGHWDRGRLDQVITNLLSNAIKYGGGKPIRIRVAGAPDAVLLEVHDRGIGIRLEDQVRIFGRFERAVSERNYGGFGLGLWIVRQLVEAHGGAVRSESRPGHGATFTVDLPRR